MELYFKTCMSKTSSFFRELEVTRQSTCSTVDVTLTRMDSGHYVIIQMLRVHMTSIRMDSGHCITVHCFFSENDRKRNANSFIKIP